MKTIQSIYWTNRIYSSWQKNTEDSVCWNAEAFKLPKHMQYEPMNFTYNVGSC
uniref:Uncharacterized protein n=1 Tax=Rhizophora mucronata TaxID=61149 RepID=A0A2P2PAD0_RHIMU